MATLEQVIQNETGKVMLTPSQKAGVLTLLETVPSTVTNFTALKNVAYVELTVMKIIYLTADEESEGTTIYPGPYGLYPNGQIRNLLNGEILRIAQI